MDLFESISIHKLIKLVNPSVITTYCQLMQAKMEMYAQIYTYFCRCSRYSTAVFVERMRKIMTMDFGVRIDFVGEDLHHNWAKEELKKA